jgi:hypothetical protein
MEMLEKKQIKINVSNENLKLTIFNVIPYFEIDWNSQYDESINKIRGDSDYDKILSSLKIRFNLKKIYNKTFNSVNDFKAYLAKIIEMQPDDKITKTLIEKYGINIRDTNDTSPEGLQNLSNIKIQEKIKESINKIKYNFSDFSNFFNDQDFDLKYNNLKDFKRIIFENFNDNKDTYNDIAAKILLFKNITILDCMNIFHNYDYKETLRNISNLKSLNNNERLDKLKEFNIDINQQIQTISNERLDKLKEFNIDINQQIQTISNESLVVYVYQGSNFDGHIYYEWDKKNNSLWIEVSCLVKSENCHKLFGKNPMDDFFIIYFCSKFNSFTQSPNNNNSNLIIYSKDKFTEWNIEKNNNITIKDYIKPNNKIIIKQNRNENTLYRDVTRGNENNLEEIKKLFLKLKERADLDYFEDKERADLDYFEDKELELIINHNILIRLIHEDFNFIEDNKFDIEHNSSSITTNRDFYIAEIVRVYHLIADNPEHNIFQKFLVHFNRNSEFYQRHFEDIYHHYNIFSAPQLGKGRIYKISYNI